MDRGLLRLMSGVSVAALVASLLAGCGKGRTAITMAGSTAFQPFAERLAEEYMASHPGVSITVQGGGSAMGIQSALSGAAEIGMADMVTLPPEAQPLSVTTVARDGVAVVVNLRNTVQDLSFEQIRGIFCGTIRAWKEVGGEDHAITVVSREAGSGTRSSFEAIVKDIALTRDAVVQDSNGTIRETVANDPFAIGYLSHGLVNEKIKAIQVGGASCTTPDIMAGKYTLVRPIFLLTKGAPVGAVKEFIDYVLSQEGQALIAKDGLIPAK